MANGMDPHKISIIANKIVDLMNQKENEVGDVKNGKNLGDSIWNKFVTAEVSTETGDKFVGSGNKGERSKVISLITSENAAKSIRYYIRVKGIDVVLGALKSCLNDQDIEELEKLAAGEKVSDEVEVESKPAKKAKQQNPDAAPTVPAIPDDKLPVQEEATKTELKTSEADEVSVILKSDELDSEIAFFNQKQVERFWEEVNFGVKSVQEITPPLDVTKPKTSDNSKNEVMQNAFVGYDEEAGAELANNVFKHRNKVPRTYIDRNGKKRTTYSLHKCKTYVRKTLERLGYGTIGGNNGYQALKTLDEKADPTNHKNGVSLARIDTKDTNITLEDIPDGAIIVYYPRAKGGKNNYKYSDGHTAIVRTDPKTGVKKQVSDCVGDLTLMPDTIYYPVKQKNVDIAKASDNQETQEN